VDYSGLVWVMVDGVPRRVSEFAGLSPSKRPRATCPQCGGTLVLKLGDIRRHHAAHAPNDRCVASQPETALHIDIKYHLAAALERAEVLTIRTQCVACDESETREWLRGWDEVFVEARVGERRPDIVLRSSGRDVGAIEVLVTHAAGQGISVPWVEVRADERLLDWTIDSPLPVVRAGTHGPWRCEHHYLQAQVPALRAARVVDVYRPTGIRDRFIYRIDEWKLDGHAVRVSLRRDGREIASTGTSETGHLREAYSADVAQLTAKDGVFVDSPMRWATGDAAENLVQEAVSDMPPYDLTPLATRFPRRWFFARERGEWFLPREMRDVRWDREPYDAFAPHPAWAASRAAVRERPAVAGTWTTFVFASRPAAEMFGQPASRITRDGPISVVELNERRALSVLTSAAPDELLIPVARRLDDAGVAYLWISHPRDWSANRSHLAWAAGGRNPRGRGGVVIDGIGLYRAAEFAKLFARGDERVAPDAVRERMAARVQGLRGAPESPRNP
jgi:hypothetical protein